MPQEPEIVRTLTARSVILSALLGAHPAQAPVSWIIRLATELGQQESAVRVALTRMVAGGDLERRDGLYRLSPRLIERQLRQDRALRPDLAEWNGEWRLAIVTVSAEDSTDRAALRESLRTMKFCELREGVWTRPNNLEISLPASTNRRIILFTARSDTPDRPHAEDLFQLQKWADTARHLLAAFAETKAFSVRFTIAAAAVGHILDDPLLPEQLLPLPWPGNDLRKTYDAFREEFASYAEHLLATTPA